MNVPWSYELKGDESDNPIIYSEFVELPDDFIYPTDEMIKQILTKDNHQLQTWGRTKGVKVDDPHWIAVRGSTPIHKDPAYPRYTHQLKIRVDDGIYSRGLSKEGLLLKRGIYYILDTHSPHQIISENKNGYNVSISIDHDEPIQDTEEVIARLMEYGRTHNFTTL